MCTQKKLLTFSTNFKILGSECKQLAYHLRNEKEKLICSCFYLLQPHTADRLIYKIDQCSLHLYTTISISV